MEITTVSLVVFFVLVILFLKFYKSHSYTKQQPAPRLPPGPWQLPLIGSLHHFLLSRFRDLPHRAIHELSKTYGPVMLLRLSTVPTVVVSSAEVFMEMTKFHDVSFCGRRLSPTADIMTSGGQGIVFSPYNERWRELRKICMLFSFGMSGRMKWHASSCMVNDTVVRAAIGGRRCKHRDEFLHELEDRRVQLGRLDIFAAGSDTSAYTLQWTISELIKNPRLLLKAQSEVRDTFKGQHMLTEDNMMKLSYMHLVIKETLRLHPPAALLPRECRETCRIMGYDVPRGSAVAVNQWAIGRDSKYWDSPEEFRPERFENSGIDFRGTDFEFVPFGAGRTVGEFVQA
ncbi:hypothetical protein EJB05_15817, partial [Eragrostis curvula]